MAFDYTYVKDPLNQLFDYATPVFVDTGVILFQGFSVGLFILYLGIYGWSLRGLWRFLGRYTVRLLWGNVVLYYYDKPMPWAEGLRFAQVPAAVCDSLVSRLNMARMDALYSFCHSLLDGLQVPVTDWTIYPLVWMGELVLNAYQIILWGTIAVSFISTGLLSIVLPLFVFTILIPGASGLFWHCWSAIWQAAFFRVVAAGLVFCAATSTLTFFANEMNGDYSLSMFLAIVPEMC